jgi:hypothetical protein
MASMTMRPLMMALVVAMAWMMLPAMPLASNLQQHGHAQLGMQAPACVMPACEALQGPNTKCHPR